MTTALELESLRRERLALQAELRRRQARLNKHKSTHPTGVRKWNELQAAVDEVYRDLHKNLAEISRLENSPRPAVKAPGKVVRDAGELLAAINAKRGVSDE